MIYFDYFKIYLCNSVAKTEDQVRPLTLWRRNLCLWVNLCLISLTKDWLRSSQDLVRFKWLRFRIILMEVPRDGGRVLLLLFI